MGAVFAMIRQMLFAATAALAACANPGSEPSGIETSISVLQGNDGITPRFQELTQTPRPILQVGLIDAGSAGNMLLEARDGPYESFLSPNSASITLNRGMLHAIFGFGEGLMATEVSEPLALVLRGQSGVADRIHTYLGGDDRTVARTYRCVISDLGPRSVALIDRTVSARLMREDCRNAEQAFENLYWVDQGRGQIVQSRQWAGPNLGAVSTRRVGVPL